MSGAPTLPAGVLLAFCGDDFTGSSAVVEVMTFAGLPAVMFLQPPTAEQLRRFADYRVIGVASVARAQTPAWMDAHLPPAFAALAGLKAPVTHYKVCSTLDSSPQIGSIGHAIDIAIPILERTPDFALWRPLVVAAPGIGRYQVFGHLFAAFAGAHYRLDRHPVMQAHPVTPMTESDVGRHIARQTDRRIGLIDLAAMKQGRAREALAEEIAAGRTLVSLDVVDDETLRIVGELMWTQRRGGLFAVGSQGVEYALVAYWRAAGLLPPAPARAPAPAAREIVAVSGSVSQITAGQIEWAAANGFEIVALDAAASLDERSWRAALDGAVLAGRAALSRGRSPLIATARGPDDPAVARFTQASAGADAANVNSRIGLGLGEILARLATASGIRRAAVSGGDSSGYAMSALGLYALEAIAPIAPGAPLCRAFSDSSEIDGFEISLKGGQMGAPDYFGSVRAGGPLGARA